MFLETCHGCMEQFVYTRISKPFQKYFREMVDEDSIFDFESIDPEFLYEENWSIFDEDDQRYLGIDIPAIHMEDTTIAWRWR